MASFIIYAIVILYQGYQYGQSDQSQILPVLYALDHPGTYTNDHYVNAYLASGTNERTIFHSILRYAGYDRPIIVFGWHLLSAIALILAWLSIAGTFIKNQVLQWMCVVMILTIGFHTSTGSNELYYNQFIPSLPAKALASWALYFWLKNKFIWWSVGLILSGYLQPLVGLQLFIITTIGLISEMLLRRNEKEVIDQSARNTFPLKFVMLYLIFTIPWLYFLVINNGGHINPSSFMKIMEFRLSHHFFASDFGKIDLLAGIIFFSICLLTFKERLRWMVITAAIGCIVYEIGVEILRSNMILYTQWWKTTIWIEAFAFIAILVFVEKKLVVGEKYWNANLLIPMVILVFVGIYRFSQIFGDLPPYMQPLSQRTSDEVNISEHAQRLTPANSVFIIPYDLSAFRWYSKRNTYVDYKAMIHNEAFLNDWYTRIVQVYNFDLEAKKSGISISTNGLFNTATMSTEVVEKWKSLGVTHFIGQPDVIPGLQLLESNQTYGLFKLP